MTRRRLGLVSIAAAAIAAISLALWPLDESHAGSRADKVLEGVIGSLPDGFQFTYDSVIDSAASDEVVVSGLVFRIDFAKVMAAYGDAFEGMAEAEGIGARDLAALDGVVLSITADQWSISDYDTAVDPPRFMTQRISGFAIDIGGLLPNEDLTDFKALFGGTTIRGDMRMRYAADVETGIFDIAYFDLIIENVGAIELAGKFGGYYVWPTDDNPEADEINMETLTVHHLTFRFIDSSIFDRAMAWAASQYEMTAEGLKELGAMMIAGSVAEMPDPRLQDAAAALVAFIRDPGRLTMTVAPDKPVNMMAWGDFVEIDPTAALDQINFSLTND